MTLSVHWPPHAEICGSSTLLSGKQPNGFNYYSEREDDRNVDITDKGKYTVILNPARVVSKKLSQCGRGWNASQNASALFSVMLACQQDMSNC